MGESVSVLVVGAGPTGLLLAAELHRRGVQCLLVDAHDRPMEWDRATVVHPRSLEIFEALGIVEPLLAAGVKQRRARIHSGGEVLGEIDLELCGSRYTFNIGVSEEITERLLTDNLFRQGGGVVRATKLVALAEQEDHILATLEHEGAQRQVLADWVVGCDGHHSAVRRFAGIEQDGHDIAEPWAVFDASIPAWPDSHEANYAYLDELPVILTALPERRWRIYLRPSSMDSDLAGDALRTLQRYLPGASFEGASSPNRFQCHTKVARRFRQGRILLAGDAAHTCSPAQGHGMNSGLQDAFNLAWKLALVCQDRCAETLLDSYQAERRPVADMVMASGDAAEAAQMIRGSEERRLRDDAIRSAFAEAKSRHHEAVAEAELDIDYASSPIVAGQPHEILWPGRRLPDRIEVRLRNGERDVLRNLIYRRGHTALLIGDASSNSHLFQQASVGLIPSFEPTLLEATVILAVDDTITNADGFLEPAAAEKLSAGPITLLVIRPDGHVGLRAEDNHAQMMSSYVDLLGASRA